MRAGRGPSPQASRDVRSLRQQMMRSLRSQQGGGALAGAGGSGGEDGAAATASDGSPAPEGDAHPLSDTVDTAALFSVRIPARCAHRRVPLHIRGSDQVLKAERSRNPSAQIYSAKVQATLIQTLNSARFVYASPGMPGADDQPSAAIAAKLALKHSRQRGEGR